MAFPKKKPTIVDLDNIMDLAYINVESKFFDKEGNTILGWKFQPISGDGTPIKDCTAVMPKDGLYCVIEVKQLPSKGIRSRTTVIDKVWKVDHNLTVEYNPE